MKNANLNNYQDKVRELLLKEKFNEEQINFILDDYSSFEKSQDLKSPKFVKENFQNAIFRLKDSNYSVKNLNLDSVNKNKFQAFLKSDNISPKEAYSLYLYTRHSGFILKEKRSGNSNNEHVLSLDKALNNQLPYNVILHRAVKKSFIIPYLNNSRNFHSLVGKKVEDKGFTSTSLLYDNSFAPYPDHEIVFKIFAPKGTLGRNLVPYSFYSGEYEVLLNTNDLYILDCKEKRDRDGNKKVVYTALVLSKDRECYKDVGTNKKYKVQLEENF